MPSLSLALNASNARKPIGGNSVIWRILISGAGTTTSNEEYAWDGVTTYEGKPQYDNPNGGQIYWYPATGQWLLYDNIEGSDTYNSTDLITWDVGGGLSPAPTSTLYYTP